MKILINASTIRVGGGIQVARSMIEEARAVRDGYDFQFAVSPEVAETLDRWTLDKRIVIVSPSPARLLRGFRSRRILKSLKLVFHPDITLTIFGPSYWCPRRPHLCGIGSAWIVSPSKVALSVFSPHGRLRKRLESAMKRLFLNGCSGFVVETEAMKESVLSYFPSFAHRIWVIPNTCSLQFQEQEGLTGSLLPQKRDKEFRVVTLSSDLPHKNLNIIVDIAKNLSLRSLDAQPMFYLSLPQSSSCWIRICRAAEKKGVQGMIANIGPVSPDRAPSFYYEADAMLMPSLIESFSSTYVEAMSLGIPIVTTDLPFARAICKTAALYYPPKCARAAAGRIAELMTNRSLARTLTALGLARFRDFPTPKRKLEMYLEACQDLVRRRKRHET